MNIVNRNTTDTRFPIDSQSHCALDAYSIQDRLAALAEHPHAGPHKQRTRDLCGDRCALATLRALRSYDTDLIPQLRAPFLEASRVRSQGAFDVAREELAALRSRVRADLSLSYAGALSLDVASLDWIRARPECLPLEELLQRLLRQLRLSPQLYLPAGAIEVRLTCECGGRMILSLISATRGTAAQLFSSRVQSAQLLEGFMRKAVRVAWELQLFVQPVYAARGLDGEYYDELRCALRP